MIFFHFLLLLLLELRPENPPDLNKLWVFTDVHTIYRYLFQSWFESRAPGCIEDCSSLFEAQISRLSCPFFCCLCVLLLLLLLLSFIHNDDGLSTLVSVLYSIRPLRSLARLGVKRKMEQKRDAMQLETGFGRLTMAHGNSIFVNISTCGGMR